MDVITLNDNKIALFSDIHWGDKSNCDKKITHCYDTISWIYTEIKKRNIKTVFFLGDYFDSKDNINSKTLVKAHTALKNMPDIQFYILLGNHDIYSYHNNEPLSSLLVFNELENVHLVTKLTLIKINNKTILLMPWKNEINQIDTKTDYLFGHYEFNGALYSGKVSSGLKYNMDDYTGVAPLVFSGHYHIRKEYPVKTGRLVTVGSPFQLDWGDKNNSKGFYIIDIAKNDYQFIENTNTPQYIELKWSDIKDKDIDCGKNYIRIIIDEKYDYQAVNNYVKNLQEKFPDSEIDFEFTCSLNTQLFNEKETQKSIDTATRSLMVYIDKYIDGLKISDLSVKSDKLKELNLKYYKLSANENSI